MTMQQKIEQFKAALKKDEGLSARHGRDVL